MNIELHDKAVAAAERFLERKDYEILAKSFETSLGTTIDIVAQDEDTICFIDVTAVNHDESFPDGHTERDALERAAAEWLAANSPEGDVSVRFDALDMIVVSTDRALLRFHQNRFGSM